MTIDITLSGFTTLGQSGSGSDGNKGEQPIPQSSSITKVSPSDCLVSYPGLSLGQSYHSVKDAVSVFYSPSRLGHQSFLNVKTVLFQTIQFSTSAHFLIYAYLNDESSILNNSV